MSKIRYKNLRGYKYELMSSLSVELPELEGVSFFHSYFRFKNNVLTIRDGYCWDGATGVPDNPDNMRASLVHDVLYQAMREGLLDRKYKDAADSILRRLCIEDGMKQSWADRMFWGVQTFGKGATLPAKKPKGEIIEI